MELDTNGEVTCPYNSEHKMKYTRLIYHLAKGCRDQLKSAHSLEVCRYNWVHRVTKAELESHESNCPSKDQGISTWESPGTWSPSYWADLSNDN